MTIDNEELNSSIVETVDENGNPIKFEVIDVIEVDGQNYGILYPIDDAEEIPEDEAEAVVMRLIQEDEDYLFECIEDDEEFEKVSSYIESLQEDL